MAEKWPEIAGHWGLFAALQGWQFIHLPHFLWTEKHKYDVYSVPGFFHFISKALSFVIWGLLMAYSLLKAKKLA